MPVAVAVWASAMVTTTGRPVPEPAGVTAVIEVAETQVGLVAATPPMVTVTGPADPKFVPVMVMVVPPADVPVPGVTADAVGTACLTTVTPPVAE